MKSIRINLDLLQLILYNNEYMFKELDTVVLTLGIKEKGLTKGDIGTIVHIHDQGKAFEVEFVTAEGKTVAVLTLSLKDIRSMARSEILHVRGYSAA